MKNIRTDQPWYSLLLTHLLGSACAATLALGLASADEEKGDSGEPAGKPDVVSGPIIKEGTKVSIHGTLQGGMVAIGGETTGWVLRYQTKLGGRKIEVDCSGLDPERIPEGEATVTGRIVKKMYIERGSILILKATGIEKRE